MRRAAFLLAIVTAVALGVWRWIRRPRPDHVDAATLARLQAEDDSAACLEEACGSPTPARRERRGFKGGPTSRYTVAAGGNR